MKTTNIIPTSVMILSLGFAFPISGQGTQKGDQAAHPSVLVDQSGINFEYLSTMFQNCKSEKVPRYTMQENGTDIPLDVAPEHTKFTLLVQPSKLLPAAELDNFGMAKIHFIPLSDPSVPKFASAYTDLSQCRSDLIKIFNTGIPLVAPRKDLPDWNCVDIGQTIHSKIQVVETSWCKGLQFITEYTQEETGIDNAGLTFVFQGITNDGKYYVAVWIPVAHPSLPLKADYIDQKKGESYESYSARVNQHYSEIEKKLNQQPDVTFVPSLQQLRQFIGTFRNASK